MIILNLELGLATRAPEVQKSLRRAARLFAAGRRHCCRVLRHARGLFFGGQLDGRSAPFCWNPGDADWMETWVATSFIYYLRGALLAKIGWKILKKAFPGLGMLCGGVEGDETEEDDETTEEGDEVETLHCIVLSGSNTSNALCSGPSGPHVVAVLLCGFVRGPEVTQRRCQGPLRGPKSTCLAKRRAAPPLRQGAVSGLRPEASFYSVFPETRTNRSSSGIVCRLTGLVQSANIVLVQSSASLLGN